MKNVRSRYAAEQTCDSADYLEGRGKNDVVGRNFVVSTGSFEWRGQRGIYWGADVLRTRSAA